MKIRKLSLEEKENRLAKRRLKKYNETHKMIDEIECKICSRCEEWHVFNEENFYPNKSNGIDGLNPYCIKCSKSSASSWQNENRDKKRQSDIKYSKKPDKKEGIKEKKKRYRENGGQLNWQQSNKDKLKNYSHQDHDISDEQWDACKRYFNNECAYCGLHFDNHFQKYRDILRKCDLHQEHVDHNGENDLSNCIPSCVNCNSQKWVHPFEVFYNKTNKSYSEVRRTKISQWLNDDYKQYI